MDLYIRTKRAETRKLLNGVVGGVEIISFFNQINE
jgi:hypothetical protein